MLRYTGDVLGGEEVHFPALRRALRREELLRRTLVAVRGTIFAVEANQPLRPLQDLTRMPLHGLRDGLE
jgi:hypothetical protein